VNRFAIHFRRSKGTSSPNQRTAIRPIEYILRLRFAARSRVGKREDDGALGIFRHGSRHPFRKRTRLARNSNQDCWLRIADDVEQSDFLGIGDLPFGHVGPVAGKRLLFRAKVFSAFHEESVPIHGIETRIDFLLG